VFLIINAKIERARVEQLEVDREAGNQQWQLRLDEAHKESESIRQELAQEREQSTREKENVNAGNLTMAALRIELDTAKADLKSLREADERYRARIEAQSQQQVRVRVCVVFLHQKEIVNTVFQVAERAERDKSEARVVVVEGALNAERARAEQLEKQVRELQVKISLITFVSSNSLIVFLF
jgi:hypothetical protein